jgi:hypothetical protein
MRTRAARHVVVGTPTYCATPVDEGCAVAVIDRSHAVYRLGGLPAPVGTTGRSSLVELTGLRELVSSVVGEAATPVAPDVSGTLVYWDGSAFQTVILATSLAGRTTSLVLPPSSYTAVYSGVTVTVTLNLVLQPPKVELTGPPTGVPGVPDCSTETCTRNVTTDSVVAGTLTYDIRNGPVQLANFTVNAALGGTVAKTSYKAAGA